MFPLDLAAHPCTHVQTFFFYFFQRSEVGVGDNWACICFSCLSTSQCNDCISIFSKKLQLNIFILLSNFTLVALFCVSSCLAFCFMQLFHSHFINIALFFPFLQTALCLCVPFSCFHLNPHQYHSINIPLFLHRGTHLPSLKSMMVIFCSTLVIDNDVQFYSLVLTCMSHYFSDDHIKSLTRAARYWKN